MIFFCHDSVCNWRGQCGWEGWARAGVFQFSYFVWLTTAWYVLIKEKTSSLDNRLHFMKCHLMDWQTTKFKQTFRVQNSEFTNSWTNMDFMNFWEKTNVLWKTYLIQNNIMSVSTLTRKHLSVLKKMLLITFTFCHRTYVVYRNTATSLYVYWKYWRLNSKSLFWLR